MQDAVTVRRLIGERLEAQLLAGRPAADALAVAERLLAVQAQDPRGVRLAIRARTSGLTAADVDRALTHERSLVITWLNRGTLHLVRSDDYRWLHALTTPPLFTANMRRLAQEGVTPTQAERGVATIARSLAEEGPLTRAQLAERVARAGVPTAGQALVHLLMLASLRGLIVRGPMIGREHAYALVRDWLPDSPPVERGRALEELGRRDLAKWAGLPLRDARAALDAIASELDERPDGLVALAGRRDSTEVPPPRLLGSFDPVLLGWRSRAPLLGSHERTVTVGGLFRPFALVRGRAAATWSIRAGEVVLEPFEPLAQADAAALASDARDVVRYLGAT
jgi:hypothetical protein